MELSQLQRGSLLLTSIPIFTEWLHEEQKWETLEIFLLMFGAIKLLTICELLD